MSLKPNTLNLTTESSPTLSPKTRSLTIEPGLASLEKRVASADEVSRLLPERFLRVDLSRGLWLELCVKLSITPSLPSPSLPSGVCMRIYVHQYVYLYVHVRVV